MSAKIAAALHEVMSKVGYVQKTGRNAFHNYRYAGEADLLEKLRPAMLEAGLLLVPSVETVSPVDEHGNTHVRVAYTLMHKDGEVWPEKVYAAGCGNDKSKNGSVGDKGVYKAMTGANKYLLFKLFQIETGDEPEATEAPLPAPTPRPAPARAIPAEIGRSPDAPPGMEQKMADGLIAAGRTAQSEEELDAWKAEPNVKSTFRDLSDAEQNRVTNALAQHRQSLKARAA